MDGEEEEEEEEETEWCKSRDIKDVKGQRENERMRRGSGLEEKLRPSLLHLSVICSF